jgi:alanyl-tRNA synthetase
MRNHTATHLMHAALRQVLGTHVEQKGSLVNDQNLRFDFSHFSKLSKEETRKIEAIVNEQIRANILRDVQVLPIEEARKTGAMALFGEKYGDLVRVVTFDKSFSVELCGGTHVPATGQIGYFKIVSESAVAAGVRRIEAITGEAAELQILEDALMVEQIKEILKGAKDPLKGIQQILDEKQELEKKLDQLQREKAGQIRKSLDAKIEQAGTLKRLIDTVDLDSPELIKNIAFDLKSIHPDLILVLGHQSNGKPMLTVALGDQAVNQGLNASNLVKDLAKEINGGGGGQVFYATAGGSKPEGLNAALEKAKALKGV